MCLYHGYYLRIFKDVYHHEITVRNLYKRSIVFHLLNWHSTCNYILRIADVVGTFVAPLSNSFSAYESSKSIIIATKLKHVLIKQINSVDCFALRPLEISL